MFAFGQTSLASYLLTYFMGTYGDIIKQFE